MNSRHALVLAGLFWAVMNVFLWRAEFGDGVASDVPPAAIWAKILDAADHSVLGVRLEGRTVGTLEWQPGVDEAPRTNGPAEIEGLVSGPTGYSVRLNAKFFGRDAEFGRMLVSGSADFSPGRDLRRFRLRVDRRPRSWEVHADLAEGRVDVAYEEGRRRTEQRFLTRDLAGLLAMLGPYATMLPPGLSPDPSLLTPSALEKNLRWRARNDVVRIGRNRVRTYRLDMSFAGHVEAGVQVSRAGEILRVQLPGNLQLVGDAFLGLEQPATPAP